MVVTDLLNVSTLRLKFVHLFLQDYARSIIQTRNKYYLHLIKMESWLGTCKSIEHFIITDSLFLLLRNTYAKNWAGLTLIAILRLQLSKSFKNWILAWLTARKIEFSEVNNFLWKITYFLTNFISFIGTWTRLLFTFHLKLTNMVVRSDVEEIEIDDETLCFDADDSASNFTQSKICWQTWSRPMYLCR